MKDIKFRAYIKHLKMIVKVVSINFDAKTIEALVGEDDFLHNDPCEYHFDQVEIMQYSGLKDEQGIEIYEGDILEKEPYSGWFCELKDGSFRKVPLVKIQRNNMEHYPVNQETLSDWKIIGNIFENSELIEFY